MEGCFRASSSPPTLSPPSNIMQPGEMVLVMIASLPPPEEKSHINGNKCGLGEGGRGIILDVVDFSLRLLL